MKIARDFVVSGVLRSQVSRLAGVGEGPKLLNDETRPFRGASDQSVLRCKFGVWLGESLSSQRRCQRAQMILKQDRVFRQRADVVVDAYSVPPAALDSIVGVG